MDSISRLLTGGPPVWLVLVDHVGGQSRTLKNHQIQLFWQDASFHAAIARTLIGAPCLDLDILLPDVPDGRQTCSGGHHRGPIAREKLGSRGYDAFCADYVELIQVI